MRWNLSWTPQLNLGGTSDCTNVRGELITLEDGYDFNPVAATIYQGTASAVADFGILGASSSIQVTDGRVLTADPIAASAHFAEGEARFRDVLRFGGGSGPLSVQLVFTLSGTSSYEGPLGGFARGSIEFAYEVPASGFSDEEGCGIGTGTTTCESQPIPLEFGDDLSVFLRLEARTEYNNRGRNVDLYDVDATADFLSTATLSGFAFFDDAGQPLEGVTVSSDSGTTYPIP